LAILTLAKGIVRDLLLFGKNQCR